ncbi:lipopolysaccharide biosynthesis protein [Geobacter sp. DSM 9736]|uniref:lipopolysaccharide biosynthesis protein n=1 Tax=Geobacter sp. DSM 9736 TaxID=1277350 RepID=UPI000B503D7C|nr:oligosaccharide flippase family protein [Geobacter sp. DSM 9736]SNB45050.1 Membrane protein involved in the export of O-antigen and teichoic acid [Geobacter sp. DSM 9736]
MIKSVLSSELCKSASIYTLSRIINAAIPFLIMPVLTRYLTPTDYGIVAMFGILVGIVSPFVGLSLHGAVSVKYFDNTELNLPKYIGNCVFVLLASTVLVSGVMWLFSEPIAKLSSFPTEWLWAVVLVAFAQFISLIALTIWQVENKPARFGAFQNLQVLVNVGLSVFFVVVMGRGWQGRLEGQIVTLVFFAAIALVLLRKNGWLKYDFDRGAIRHALAFGVPLIPHALGVLLIMQTDRIFLTNMAGIATAGIYSVAYQFGSIIDLGASSFNQAYAPWLYRQLPEINDEGKRRIVRMTYAYFVFVFFAAILLSTVVPFFLSFYVGKDFIGAQAYIFWICLGFSFSAMYYMVTNYIFFAGKTGILAWVTFISAMLNIGFNYLFIKLNGPVGAAQASALTFSISFVLTWILSAKVYPMPWNLFKRAAC